GPDSIAGIDRDKGLNENLARETLELHTLGVRSGYSQADVTNFAKILTGWTWLRPEEPVHGGEFVFVRRFHEPGDQVVLGKRYTEEGSIRAVLCLPIWRAIQRRRSTSAKSSLGILSLTIRRRRLR